MYQNKAELRKKMLHERKVYKYSKQDSAALCETIMAHEFFGANSVMMYMPINGECDLIQCMQCALEQGKKMSIPYIDKNNMLCAGEITDLRQVEAGKFGILEPVIKKNVYSIDCVFVPGIAFDQNGARVGYGKGYYDVFLSGVKAKRIGCAYDFQVMDFIEIERHDCKMDLLVTPYGGVKNCCLNQEF